jgi:outer membrane cobalamin receptor
LTLNGPGVTIVGTGVPSPPNREASMKALLLSLTLALAGCGPATNQNANTVTAPGTFLITADQIEKSGANTAWQVLRQRAPMLTMREDRNGRPQSMGRRGRSSFLLDEAPMVLLDGVRVPDFHALDAIDARSILTILIYDGVEGTTYYGTDAVSGVIVIKTKDGSES